MYNTYLTLYFIYCIYLTVVIIEQVPGWGKNWLVAELISCFTLPGRVESILAESIGPILCSPIINVFDTQILHIFDNNFCK